MTARLTRRPTISNVKWVSKNHRAIAKTSSLRQTVRNVFAVGCGHQKPAPGPVQMNATNGWFEFVAKDFPCRAPNVPGAAESQLEQAARILFFQVP